MPSRLQRIRAAPNEEEKKLIIDGYNVDEKDFWEGETAELIFKGGIVAVSVAAVVFLLFLAKPVIDNTIEAFPVR
jgi:hypothetical protein